MRRFAGSRRGAIAVMAAICLPVLIGFTGMTVDIGLWYASSVSLTTGAQAAAMATSMATTDGVTDISTLDNMAGSAALSSSSDLTADTGISIVPGNQQNAAASATASQASFSVFSTIIGNNGFNLSSTASARSFTNGSGYTQADPSE